MTLWLFGDGFIQPFNNTNQWMYKVADNLNTDIQSLALQGTALEFTYQRFNIARQKIKENDIVIVSLTNFDRRWFFKGYPEYAEFDKSPTDNKKENKAIDLFRKYLDHKEIHRIYLIDFLYNLYAITEELNLHTIIIPNFEDVENFLNDKRELFPLFHITKGYFSQITNNQNKEMNFIDNEISVKLSNVIIDNIVNKKTIDLNQI